MFQRPNVDVVVFEPDEGQLGEFTVSCYRVEGEKGGKAYQHGALFASPCKESQRDQAQPDQSARHGKGGQRFLDGIYHEGRFLKSLRQVVQACGDVAYFGIGSVADDLASWEIEAVAGLAVLEEYGRVEDQVCLDGGF